MTLSTTQREVLSKVRDGSWWLLEELLQQGLERDEVKELFDSNLIEVRGFFGGDESFYIITYLGIEALGG